MDGRYDYCRAASPMTLLDLNTSIYSIVVYPWIPHSSFVRDGHFHDELNFIRFVTEPTLRIHGYTES